MVNLKYKVLTEGGWIDPNGEHHDRRAVVDVPEAVGEYYGWSHQPHLEDVEPEIHDPDRLDPVDDFDCPFCGAEAGDPCVTESGNETSTHADRGG